MRVLLTVAALLVVVGAASVSLEDLQFQNWKLEFGKRYGSDEEESQRKMIWMENLKLVLQHNILADQGLKSYRLGMNQFADMSEQEHQIMSKSSLRSFRRNKASNVSEFFRQEVDAALPSFVNWTAKGYVTEVKNQSHCFSCWAFSAAGALEGQVFRKTGVLVSLSAQQLLDCSWMFDNEGCAGGSMEEAFLYVNFTGGLEKDSMYPYTAREDACNFTPLRSFASCRGFVELKSGEEELLQKAVTAVGPVSAAVDTSKRSFLLYQSGIYNEPNCSSYNVDHAVLVVGYGTDAAGRDYWIVKNSWSVQWGERGYIRMSRNKENQCGISSRASYPLV